MKPERERVLDPAESFSAYALVGIKFIFVDFWEKRV